MNRHVRDALPASVMCVAWAVVCALRHAWVWTALNVVSILVVAAFTTFAVRRDRRRVRRRQSCERKGGSVVCEGRWDELPAYVLQHVHANPKIPRHYCDKCGRMIVIEAEWAEIDGPARSAGWN